MDSHLRPCEECGAPFVPSRPNARYCTERHRKTAELRRWRHKRSAELAHLRRLVADLEVKP